MGELQRTSTEGADERALLVAVEFAPRRPSLPPTAILARDATRMAAHADDEMEEHTSELQSPA